VGRQGGVRNAGALMKSSPDDIKCQLMALPAGTTWRQLVPVTHCVWLTFHLH